MFRAPADGSLLPIRSCLTACVLRACSQLSTAHTRISHCIKVASMGMLHYASTIAESCGRLSCMGWPHYVSGRLDMCQETQQLRDRHPVSLVQSTGFPLCV